MASLDLRISNMHCDNCVRHVKEALQRLPGVSVQDVTVGSATLQYDEQQASPERIATALQEAGYPAEPK